ncbi:MAG: CDP-diacylglycerol--serine O-phosphatidyltransferase [Gammaproteobacteria bacterium]|nr:CDP-diacylglycerol--serine O-phosphatidyltransferase [Gammaproteobacteria bacterium]
MKSSKKVTSLDRARRRGIYLLPNLFTTAALFAGFYAVVAAIDGNFRVAAIAIFVAMLLDGMDGRVARLTNTESDFGKEYDSLSDMVSFGLAPSLVVYQWGAASLAEYGWAWGKFGWLAAFFYTVAAALRLARFNTQPAKAGKHHFQGLPSPSAAGLVAGLIWYGSDAQLTGLVALAAAFLITAMAGGLMVSNFRYLSLKNVSLGENVPFAYVLLIPLIFMLIALDPPRVLFLIALTYAFSGPALTVWGLFRKSRSRRGAEPAEDDSGLTGAERKGHGRDQGRDQG